MSGHSKWAKIKRKKGANDEKRGALFTKIAKNITIAASEGGGDPDMNFSLRLAIDKAKAANMPGINIERAVKKGTGEGGETVQIQRISYEAIMGSDIAFIIDTQTDNTNRTVSELRKIVETQGGKFVAAGSAAWQFNEAGFITIRTAKLKKAEKFGAEDTYEDVDLEESQLELLEIPGIEDIQVGTIEDDNGNEFTTLEILTEKNEFAKVLSEVESLNYKIESAELIKIANEEREVSKDEQEKVEKMMEVLDEHDDVDSVWVNVKMN